MCKAYSLQDCTTLTTKLHRRLQDGQTDPCSHLTIVTPFAQARQSLSVPKTAPCSAGPKSKVPLKSSLSYHQKQHLRATAIMSTIRADSQKHCSSLQPTLRGHVPLL
jgi:hypothetical protein